MKDGRTHLAYKAEHTIDLESEFILDATVYYGDESDGDTLLLSITEAQKHLDAAGSETPLDEVVADFRPNQLTAYLFDLANCFASFYDECPVLTSENQTTRESRLALCDLTARTLKQGLAILGIDVVEKM